MLTIPLGVVYLHRPSAYHQPSDRAARTPSVFGQASIYLTSQLLRNIIKPHGFHQIRQDLHPFASYHLRSKYPSYPAPLRHRSPSIGVLGLPDAADPSKTSARRISHTYNSAFFFQRCRLEKHLSVVARLWTSTLQWINNRRLLRARTSTSS